MRADLDTLRAFFRRAPFMVDLGVEPTAVQAGTVSTVLALAERHLQHTGQVHAGVSAAMADHSMGAAAQTMAPQGHWVLTAELKTSLGNTEKAPRGARFPPSGASRRCKSSRYLRVSLWFAPCAASRTRARASTGTSSVLPLLRAAKGERLVCEARVIKAGRMLSFTEAEVYCESGGERVFVMKASATMAVTAQSKHLSHATHP